MRTVDYQRLASFRFALRGFLHFSEVAASKLGVTGLQYQALLFLRSRSGSDPVAISDLAQELLIQHNSAVGLVDRLTSQGLMERKQVPEDRRKVQLVLTPKGEQVLSRLAQVHRRKLAKISPEIHKILRELAGVWRRSG